MIFEIGVIAFLTLVDYSYLQKSKGNQKSLFLLATIFRIGLLYYQTKNQNLPMAGGDWGVFHSQAIYILNSQTGILGILFCDYGDFYTHIVAVMYYIFGINDHLMYLFSYIMSQLAFIYVYKIAFAVSRDANISSTAAIIFYLWPMEMIFSVAYLREMTIQFVFAVSFYYFTRYLFQKNLLYYGIACLLSFLCAQIHSGMIAVLAAYIALLFFYNSRTGKLKITPVKVCFVLLVCVLLYGSGLLNSGLSRFSSVENLSDAYAMAEVEASSTYISSPGSLWGAILQTPIRLFYFVTAPWPWHIRSFGTLISYILDGVLRLYVVREIYKSYHFLKRTHSVNKDLFVAIFIVWVLTELIFSWGTNNFGTAMRHRLKVFPIEIVLMYVLKKLEIKKYEANFL